MQGEYNKPRPAKNVADCVDCADCARLLIKDQNTRKVEVNAFINQTANFYFDVQNVQGISSKEQKCTNSS